MAARATGQPHLQRQGRATLRGGSGNDVLRGGSNDDFIDGSSGFDQIYGNAGNDTLRGGDDTDYLAGSDGHDILIGGAGKDQLEGGLGADIYHFSGGFGDDQIIETASGGADTIDFSYGPDGAVSAGLSFNFSGANTVVTSGGNIVRHDGNNLERAIGGDGSDVHPRQRHHRGLVHGGVAATTP